MQLKKSQKVQAISQYKNSLKFSSLPYEIVETMNSILKRERDRCEGLAKDIYVEEALNVLDDLQTKVILKRQVLLN
jgi:carboxyl-terminal processing protease